LYKFEKIYSGRERERETERDREKREREKPKQQNNNKGKQSKYSIIIIIIPLMSSTSTTTTATVVATSTTAQTSTTGNVEVTQQLKLIPREEEIRRSLLTLRDGIPLDPLPEIPHFDAGVPHAPKRLHHLSLEQQKQAIKNALRYFPKHLHTVLAPEFAEELRTEGHIYMRRFRPMHYSMKAYPIDYYPARCKQGLSRLVVCCTVLSSIIPS